jgi:hypothetical protein
MIHLQQVGIQAQIKAKPKKNYAKEICTTQKNNNNMCVLEFQIIKNDLRSHNLGLYPINKYILTHVHT